MSEIGHVYASNSIFYLDKDEENGSTIQANSINLQKVSEIASKLKSLTLPYQDQKGHLIKLWEFKGNLLGGVLDSSGNLTIVPEERIFNALNLGDTARVLIDKLKNSLNKSWDIAFNIRTLSLTIWPHLKAAGKYDHVSVEDTLKDANSRLNNLVYDKGGLNKKHYYAHQREVRGEVVKMHHTKGRPYNHIQDVQDSQRGASRLIQDIKSKLSQNLSSEERQALEKFLGKASKTLDASRIFTSKKQDASPSIKQFHEKLQKTHLVGSYNAHHPDRPAPKGGGSGGTIGGVGCTLEPIRGLFDSAEAFFEEAHYFYLSQLVNGEAPFSDQELRQILRELTIGIYQYDTIPFFSLHFNLSSDQYPVIHPVYEKTLIGQVISMLDYMMKGYLNGGVFEEEFVRKWHENPSWEQQTDTALKHLIDFSNYCQKELDGEDKLYRSLRYYMQELQHNPAAIDQYLGALETMVKRRSDSNEEQQSILEQLKQARVQINQNTEPSIFSDFTQFSNSFRIIAKQRSIQKADDLFVLDPDFDVEYTITPSPIYKEALENYQRQHGKPPQSFSKMELAYKIICHQIHNHMVKMPLCRKYFSMLGIIHFFSCYLTTLKKHRKVPVLEAVPTSKIEGSPILFPHLPVAKLYQENVIIPLSEEVKTWSLANLPLLKEFLECGKSSDQLIELLKKQLFEFVLQSLSSGLQRHVRAEGRHSHAYQKIEVFSDNYTHDLKEKFDNFMDQEGNKVLLTIFLETTAKNEIAIDDDIRTTFNDYLQTQNEAAQSKLIFFFLGHFQAPLDQIIEQMFNTYQEGSRNGDSIDLPNTIRAWQKALTTHPHATELKKVLELGAFTNYLSYKQERDKEIVFSALKEIAQTSAQLFIQKFNKPHSQNMLFDIFISILPEELKDEKFPLLVEENVLSLSKELTTEEREQGKRIVGGCGMRMETYRVQSSPIGEAVQVNNWSTIEALRKLPEGLESFALVSDKENQEPSGVVFRLAFENLPLWVTHDFNWMNDLLLAPGQEEEMLYSASQKISTAITLGDEEKFLDLICPFSSTDLQRMRMQEECSLLHLAAMQKESIFIRTLLDKGLSNDHKDEKGNVPIHYAAQLGVTDNMSLLLKKKRANLNAQNNQGATPLYVAVQHGQLDGVCFLLEQKANSSLSLIDGYTPLQCALHHDYKKIAHALIFQSTESVINSATEEGVTALMLATELADENLVHLLLEKGAKPDAMRKDGWRALDIAIKRNSVSLCRVLSARSQITMSTVERAIQNGTLEMLQVLSETRGFFELKNELQESPLFIAVRKANIPAALFLIDRISVDNLNAKNTLGESAFTLALEAGFSSLIKVFLAKGLQIDPQMLLEKLCLSDCIELLIEIIAADHQNIDWQHLIHISVVTGKMTALVFLASKGDLSLVRGPNGWKVEHYLAKFDGMFLLQKRVRGKDFLHRLNHEQGKTLAYIAAENRSRKVLRFLVTEMLKRELSFSCHYGKNHLFYAVVESGDVHNVEFMVSLLPELLNQVLDELNTRSMHVAAKTGSKKLLKLLKKQGADCQVIDSNGYTPLDYAVRAQNKEAISFLLSDACQAIVTPLSLALAKSANLMDIFQLLRSKNPNMQPAKLPEIDTSLHTLAAKQDDLQEIKDPNGVDASGSTPIFYAIEMGNEKNVRLLLENKANPNHRNYQGITPLIQASLKNRLDIVQLLVAKGADINLKGNGQLSPLHASIVAGHDAISHYLILQGANCEASNERGELPIHTAVNHGRVTTLRWIAAKGFSLETPLPMGLAPIHLASLQGKTKILSALKAIGVSIHTPIKIPPTSKAKKSLIASEGATPLLLSLQSGKPKPVKWLLEQYVDPESVDKKGYGVLAYGAQRNAQDLLRLFDSYRLSSSEEQIQKAILEAIKKDFVGCLLLLYRLGIPLNSDILKGLPGLHLACETQSFQAAHYFLLHGYEPTRLDGQYRSALEIAAGKNSPEQLQLLLNFSLDSLNLQNREGNSLLHIAAARGQLTNVMILLDYGASLEMRNAQGFTPLHLAAQAGQIKVVRLLLGMGANTDAKSIFDSQRPINLVQSEDHVTREAMIAYEKIRDSANRQSSQMHLAVRAGIIEAVILLSDQAKKEDEKKITPLHWAAAESNLAIVKELLRQGADSNAHDSAGHTPFWYNLHSEKPSRLIQHLLLKDSEGVK